MIFLKFFAYKKGSPTGNDSKIVNTAKFIILQLLTFSVGALMSSVKFSQGFAPFGTAFMCSVDSKYLLSASFGTAAGYILTQDNLSALRYIAVILCNIVLIKLTQELELTKKFRLMPSCVSFLTLFITGAVMLLATESSRRNFFIYLSEASLGFVLSFIFSESCICVKNLSEKRGMGLRDAGLLLCSIFILLFSLDDVGILSVSVPRILIGIIILLSAYVYNQAGAAFSAVTVSLIYLIDEDIGTAAFLYAFCGMLGGIFSYYNKYIISITYILSFVTAYFAFDLGIDRVYLIAETAIAGIIFMLIPQKYLKSFKNFLKIKSEPVQTNSQRRVVLNRLRLATAAVGDVSRSMNAASRFEQRGGTSESVEFYSKVQSEVCTECRLYSFCWEKNFGDTKASFDTMCETLRSNKPLDRKELPSYLNSCCVRKLDLIESFNGNFLKFVSSRSTDEKVDKIRKVTGDQFGGIKNMLYEMSEEFSEGVIFDEELTDSVIEALNEEFNLDPKCVISHISNDGHLKLEITLDEKPKDIKETEFREVLESACQVKLSKPSVNNIENGVVVSVCEATTFKIEAAATRSCADKEKLCGDSYEGFYDGKGNYIVVLSDGMGTGKRAALDSSLTASMSAKLLKSGFSPEAALRLVNSAMLLKSSEESLATLDVVKINLYTGEADFYKAGACTTLIKRKQRIFEIKQPSMSIGILREVSFSHDRFKLDSNDLVVVASDGAFEYSGNALRNAVALSLNEDVSEISKRALKNVKTAKKGNHCDDITVITLRIVDNI